MKSKITLLMGILLFLSSCGKDYAYKVEGKLSNLEDQVVYAVFERDDYSVTDTFECVKPGKFEFIQRTEGFNSVTIYFENRSRWVTGYLKPGDKIDFSGDAGYPLLIQVKGNRINDRLSAVRKKLSPLLKEYTDLTNKLNRKQTSVEETEIASKISNINIQLDEEVVEYIKEHPDEEASVVLIDMFFTEAEDTRRMDELLAMLDPQLKNFFLTRELEQFSTRAKRTALGAEAPDFSLTNINKEVMTLDSFTDKYLLLAFTAPWCDMCQTEDLYLDRVISDYSRDQVDVLLISLDSDQRNVREALMKDTIQWNLVTDSAGQATMMLDLYNVSALPRCFLIDEEGHILLKTESGMEIKQTLHKLLEEEEEEEEE